MALTVFDTFSGIGGFSLGLERTGGFKTVGFCEIEEFPRAVLRKHWPDTWIHDDIKTLTGELIRERCGRVDVLTGGVPCQPASVAGKRRGAADDRWLWPDFLRLVSEINPVWVLAENPRGVLSLRVEGLEFGEWLAGEFQARGYELLPVELAAEDVGAPHRRERVWLVAYSNRQRKQDGRGEVVRRMDRGDAAREAAERGLSAVTQSGDLAIPARNGRREGRPESARIEGRFDAAVCGEAVADADELFNGRGTSRTRGRVESSNGGGLGNADLPRLAQHSGERGDSCKELSPAVRTGWPARPGEPQYEWEAPRVIAAESRVGESAPGLSRWLARRRVAALKALGNSVVPQCVEMIGRAILQMEVS